MNYEEAILAILCIGLPITIPLAGKWLNTLIFHDDIKCIAANGQMTIYVAANYIYMCHMTIIHFTQKI